MEWHGLCLPSRWPAMESYDDGMFLPGCENVEWYDVRESAVPESATLWRKLYDLPHHGLSC